MNSAKAPIDIQMYLESLVWRQADLRGRLELLRSQVQALQKEESDLIQEVRAIDLLIGAAGGNGTRPASQPDSTHASPDGIGSATPDFGAWSPTAREIYQRAYEVILDAGVPLHYRVLAEHIQAKVPLGGNDPGATLIAHLHRAQDIFPRLGRGVYGIAGMQAKPSVVPPVGTPGKRRQRVRRRRLR
jgi:hypothetical protein